MEVRWGLCFRHGDLVLDVVREIQSILRRSLVLRSLKSLSGVPSVVDEEMEITRVLQPAIERTHRSDRIALSFVKSLRQSADHCLISG